MVSWAVVGASRGIGFEYVRQLSQDPSNHVFAIIRSQTTAGPLHSLAAASGNVFVIESENEITYSESTPSKLTEAVAKVSGIANQSLDILIFCAYSAGTDAMHYSPSSFIGKEREFEWEITQTIQHNTINVVHTINAFLPLIRNGKIRKIVFISTGIADIPFIRKAGFSSQVGYIASKAATNTIMAKYAVELADEGIMALSLSPGWVATDAVEATLGDPNIYNFVLNSLRKVYPEVEGPMPVKESVIAQLEVIEKLTREQSGMLLSHHGDQRWL